MATLSKPVQIFLVIAVLGGTWFFLYGNEDPVKGARKSKPTATAKKGKADVFTKEDYSAKFPPLNSQPKNAFMPIIARSSSLTAAEGPTGIPVELTDGEANWTYTGTVEVNGTVQALLENPSSGQGDFVQVGQVWKKARVMQITPESITLSGPAGTAKTIRLHGAPETTGLSGTLPPARIQPPLNGAIGPLSVQPERPARSDAQSIQDGNNDAN